MLRGMYMIIQCHRCLSVLFWFILLSMDRNCRNILISTLHIEKYLHMYIQVYGIYKSKAWCPCDNVGIKTCFDGIILLWHKSYQLEIVILINRHYSYHKFRKQFVLVNWINTYMLITTSTNLTIWKGLYYQNHTASHCVWYD